MYQRENDNVVEHYDEPQQKDKDKDKDYFIIGQTKLPKWMCVAIFVAIAILLCMLYNKQNANVTPIVEQNFGFRFY